MKHLGGLLPINRDTSLRIIFKEEFICPNCYLQIVESKSTCPLYMLKAGSLVFLVQPRSYLISNTMRDNGKLALISSLLFISPKQEIKLAVRFIRT